MGLVQRLGGYFVEGTRRREGGIEVLSALNPVTGAEVLLYRPVSGMPPRIEIPRVLPYELPVEDAWPVELPFGAKSAREFVGEVPPERLLAWSRGLLAALAALKSKGLSHGRLGLDDIWVRGDAVWLSGVGVPWGELEPDEVRVVSAIKELAGDSWEGLWFKDTLLALAEGRLGLDEALSYLAEPGARPPEPEVKPEVPEKLDEKPKPSPEPPEPPPTVRVKGVRRARIEVEKEEKAEPPKPPPPPKEPKKEEEAKPKPPEPPPEVVRIEEPEDPAFEVVTPEAPSRPGRRRFLALVLALFTVLLLAGAGWWLSRPAGFSQEVRFNLVPEGARAELVVLSSPEGAGVKPGQRFEIPSAIRFDREGIYTFEVRSEGYRPKTFALEVPVIGGQVTIKLGGQ